MLFAEPRLSPSPAAVGRGLGPHQKPHATVITLGQLELDPFDDCELTPGIVTWNLLESERVFRINVTASFSK